MSPRFNHLRLWAVHSAGCFSVAVADLPVGTEGVVSRDDVFVEPGRVLVLVRAPVHCCNAKTLGVVRIAKDAQGDLRAVLGGCTWLSRNLVYSGPDGPNQGGYRESRRVIVEGVGVRDVLRAYPAQCAALDYDIHIQIDWPIRYGDEGVFYAEGEDVL